MKPISLQVTYHKGRPFAAYIHLDRRLGLESARSEEVAPDIVVDFDANDRPIGVEIISPDSTPLDEVLAVFDRLGLSRPDVAELAPLVAA